MLRPLTRHFLRPVLLSALLLIGGWVVARAPLPAVQASAALRPARQGGVIGSGPNRAALAIRFGDGEVQTQCVAFTEDNIGGDELLQRSGFNPIMSPEGAVCGIGSDGCPSDNCFCQCTDLNNCTYWAYYQWRNSAWAYSQFGIMADQVIVSNGDMQAWSWGKGTTDSGAPAPNVTFDQICPSGVNGATSTVTLTPTLTPTTTATTAAGNTSSTPLPQVTFYATLQSVAPNQCTMLNWQTLDATRVTLDGVPVAANGSQQVCLTADRSWTLVASNGNERVSRTVTIRVKEGAGGQPSATPSPVPSPRTPGATPSPALSGPSIPTVQVPIATQGPRPLVPTAAQPSLPTPLTGSSPLQPGSLPGGDVPLAPTAEPQLVDTPAPPGTPTRFVFSPLATETPRPRREIGAGGRATPTPLLIARAAGSGGAEASAAGPANRSASGSGERRQLVQSRAFTPTLLPQYAAYLAIMAVLLAMGWYVLRRRQGGARTPANQSDRDAEV